MTRRSVASADSAEPGRPIGIVIPLVVAVVLLSGRGFLENMGPGIILQSGSAFSPGDQISTNDCVSS